MDRHTKAIYKRGAIVVLPILAVVGCRVGLRACVAIDRSERNRTMDEAVTREAEQQRALEQAAALATSEATVRARTRLVPTAAPGSHLAPIASAQQVPDSLAVDAKNVAWLATRSGEVMVAPRAGGTARVVAKDQKLLQRRHGQGLALTAEHVYWITAPLPSSREEDGSILRASLTGDAAEPEVVASGLGGLSALLVDKDSVYYARSLRVSRDEDGGATGGVYRIKLGPKAKPAKDAQLLFAAERPCALAADDTSVYVAETLKLWRVAKTATKGSAAKSLVNGGDRLGCTVAVDPENVYWTIPGDDSLMRAKKSDGSGVGVAAFTRKRPTNVVVDQGYAYVLTETSPQALGELGSIFKVPLRSERLTPQALVTEQVGLGSVAASSGFVVFSSFNEAESDGAVLAITTD